MRDLNEFELKFVSGAGSSPSGDCTCTCPPTTPTKTRQGNNGFGNGSDDPNLAAPGGSGKTGGGKEGSVGDSRGAR
jgi:hypothetical protein